MGAIAYWAVPPPRSWIGAALIADAAAFLAAMAALVLRRRRSARAGATVGAALSLGAAACLSAAVAVLCYRGFAAVPAHAEFAAWRQLPMAAGVAVSGSATVVAAVGLSRLLRRRATEA